MRWGEGRERKGKKGEELNVVSTICGLFIFNRLC